MTAGWWLIIGLSMVGIGAILNTIVLSLHRCSRGRLAAMAEDRGGATQHRIERLIADRNGHAAGVALLRIPVLLFAGFSMVLWAMGMRSVATPEPASIAIGLGVCTALVWVVGVVAPQAVARHGAERTLMLLAPIATMTHLLLGPLRVIVRFMDEVARRLVAPEHPTEENRIDAELLSVVTEGEREGHIDEAERDMLEAVVEFRSTTVEQIMTPRTEIDALGYTDDIEEVQTFVDEHGHSRVPIYDDSLDKLIGVLYAKDLLHWIIEHGGNGTPFVLKDILREATWVPETKTVRELLTQLLSEKVHIAMVADEYGGTSGIVTMEDIVEEIFGDIQDEYEDPTDEELKVEVHPETRSATIDARIPIDDANDELEAIGMELPESDEYDTVAGFVSATLGRIPDEGESFQHEEVRVEILGAEPTRVTRVRLTVAEPEPSVAGEHDAK